MRYEESDKVKLKREMVDHLDKEIVAFLNARGGVIYIGVDDQGKSSEPMQKSNPPAVMTRRPP